MPAPKHMQYANALKIINSRGVVSDEDGAIAEYSVEDVCDAAILLINVQQAENEELNRRWTSAYSDAIDYRDKYRRVQAGLSKVDARRYKAQKTANGLAERLGVPLPYPQRGRGKS